MNYLTDLLHAAAEVAPGASGIVLLVVAMFVFSARDERRHARAQAARFRAAQSRARVIHPVDRERA